MENYVLHAKPILQAQFQLIYAQHAEQDTELRMELAYHAPLTATSVPMTYVKSAQMDTLLQILDHAPNVLITVYSAKVPHHHVLPAVQDTI